MIHRRKHIVQNVEGAVNTVEQFDRENNIIELKKASSEGAVGGKLDVIYSRKSSRLV